MNRDEVIAAIDAARETGDQINLYGANLAGADLRDLDFRYANLVNVNLAGANARKVNLAVADARNVNLTGADARHANLEGAALLNAHLAGANLAGANLATAHLAGANLTGANLIAADLAAADLTAANLENAYLKAANLKDANEWGGFRLDGLPSGQVTMTPRPKGWHLEVGCWAGTIDALETLIAGDDWPEAEDDEREARRPGLVALIAVLRAHTRYHADKLAAVQNKWGSR